MVVITGSRCNGSGRPRSIVITVTTGQDIVLPADLVTSWPSSREAARTWRRWGMKGGRTAAWSWSCTRWRHAGPGSWTSDPDTADRNTDSTWRAWWPDYRSTSIRCWPVKGETCNRWFGEGFDRQIKKQCCMLVLSATRVSKMVSESRSSWRQTLDSTRHMSGHCARARA